jgi:hypothetical protein
MGWTWLIVAAVVVVLGLWYLSTTAGRLDRLNRRVESAQHSLETQLLRRASLATELAASGLLDPAASAVLADAAHAVRVAPQDRSPQRAAAESDLTAVLGALFADPADVKAMRQLPGGDEFADELDMATRRVAMSRRFLNDGVRANRDVRSQKVVRWFPLAGTSVAPDTFEFDDEPPRGFGVR